MYQPQLCEATTFATSPIAEATTRNLDSMTLPSAALTTAFLTGKWQVQVIPEHSNADVIADTSGHVIFLIDANDFLGIVESGGDAIVVWSANGNIISRIITYSRDQKLTITLDFAAGDLTVAGATTGDGTTNGTANDWTTGTLYVGLDDASGQPSFGLISEPVIVS